MATMSVLVMICIWVLGFYKLEALGALMGSLGFFLFGLCLSYLCSCLSLFHAIIVLHALDGKMVKDFSLESESGFYM